MQLFLYGTGVTMLYIAVTVGMMLLCIVVATVSSLVSARFANRVKNRTIGLVTGAVLTVLGAVKSMGFIRKTERADTLR